MARKKTKATTLQIPPPPQGERRENLSVEIPVSVAWRIEMGLFELKKQGCKTTKQAFVQQLLLDGLDKFDEAQSKRKAA